MSTFSAHELANEQNDDHDIPFHTITGIQAGSAASPLLILSTNHPRRLCPTIHRSYTSLLPYLHPLPAQQRQIPPTSSRYHHYNRPSPQSHLPHSPKSRFRFFELSNLNLNLIVSFGERSTKRWHRRCARSDIIKSYLSVCLSIYRTYGRSSASNVSWSQKYYRSCARYDMIL